MSSEVNLLHFPFTPLWWGGSVSEQRPPKQFSKTGLPTCFTSWQGEKMILILRSKGMRLPKAWGPQPGGTGPTQPSGGCRGVAVPSPRGYAKAHELGSSALRFSVHLVLSDGRISVPYPPSFPVRGSQLIQMCKFTEYLIVFHGRTGLILI